MKSSDLKGLKYAKEAAVLKILHRGRIAGHLYRTKHGAQFEYASDYLVDPEFEGIAFHIPKRVQAYDVTGVNLHPFFAGLLPEGLRLRTMIKRLKTSEDDLFTLFAALGSRGVGDVACEDVLPVSQIKIPNLKTILFEDYFQEQLPKFFENKIGNDSFAGIQNKISASMINIPVNIAKKNYSYILKLNSQDFPTIVANEYACLKLAKRCGLKVVHAKNVKDAENNNGLLIQRFDRVWNSKQGSMEQIHTEDACQFLNLYPGEKYRISMNKIAESIQEWSPAREIDVLNLIEQYIFSYLVCNGDLHAKNISLVREYPSDRVSLSHAYDIVCTLPYGDDKMALKMDGRDDNIKRQTLLQFGMRYGISKSIIIDRSNKLIRKFEKNLPQFLLEMSLVLNDSRKLNHLERVIKKRLADVSH